MKLEGSLDAFSLPDMFQLLSFTKKTGGLHLAHDGSDGVVFFTSGQITGASADSSRQPLARRLVGSGTLTDEALTAAVDAAGQGEGLGIVRALLEHGAVDADMLRRAATDQSVDAVFDLLRWRDGDFAFVMDEANPDDVGVTLSVESVIADTESRQSTWDTVSQVVPSPRAVLSMPVVLPTKAEQTAWLDPGLDAEGVAPLLGPLADELTAVHPASKRVNAATYDAPDCLDADEDDEEETQLTLAI